MLRVVLILALTALTASTAWAVPVGIDDFEDGTTAGWHVGDPGAHPAPPVNVSTGGPAGAGDAYLQLEALGGGGPGSRLSVLNLSQWTGDFTSVPAIGMDVNNFGPDDLVASAAVRQLPGRARSADRCRVDARARDRAVRQRLDRRAVQPLCLPTCSRRSAPSPGRSRTSTSCVSSIIRTRSSEARTSERRRWW